MGQVFRKPPVIEDIDDGILNDIDMAGQSLGYFSRDVLSEVMETNRCGVLVDWSDKGNRPYLVQYRAMNVINWREENINGENKLSLVVLEGFVDKVKDGDVYRVEKKRRWRVLRLIDGVYTVQLFELSRGSIKEKFDQIGEDIIPVKGGSPLDFIPFYFVTAQGISSKISKSVLYDFSNVNLGHYINSADYENMLHWTGCKTHVTKGWGNENLPIGGAFDLPVDGDAFILEASSDSGLKDAMKDKESQMAILGSTLISGQGRYVASAQTATINSQGEYASLSDLSNALSVAMTEVMKIFVEWQGGSGDKVSIEFNTDFELTEVDPTLLTAYMKAVQSGFMSYEVFYYNMKNKELYPPDWSIKNEKKAIEEGQEMDMEVLGNEDEQDSNTILEEDDKIKQGA